MKNEEKEEEVWKYNYHSCFFVIIGRFSPSYNKVRRHCCRKEKKEIESQNGAQINFQQQTSTNI